MDRNTRHQKAIRYGLVANIGRRVKSHNCSSFRNGDTAEIIGWGLGGDDERPLYFIRFSNGECDAIFAGSLFAQSGFVFVD